MIFILFIVIILLFVFLILFIPVNITIIYNKNLSAKINLLGIKCAVPLNKSNKNKTKKQRIKSSSTTKSTQNKRSFDFYIKLSRIGQQTLVDILKGLTIKNFILDVKICGEDSAQTALLYAKISSIIYTFCGIIISRAKIKNHDINIYPDFLGSKTTFYLNLHFYGTIFKVLKSLLNFTKEYNKIDVN